MGSIFTHSDNIPLPLLCRGVVRPCRGLLPPAVPFPLGAYPSFAWFSSCPVSDSFSSSSSSDYLGSLVSSGFSPWASSLFILYEFLGESHLVASVFIHILTVHRAFSPTQSCLFAPDIMVHWCPPINISWIYDPQPDLIVCFLHRPSSQRPFLIDHTVT